MGGRRLLTGADEGRSPLLEFPFVPSPPFGELMVGMDGLFGSLNRRGQRDFRWRPTVTELRGSFPFSRSFLKYYV